MVGCYGSFAFLLMDGVPGYLGALTSSLPQLPLSEKLANPALWIASAPPPPTVSVTASVSHSWPFPKPKHQ